MKWWRLSCLHLPGSPSLGLSPSRSQKASHKWRIYPHVGFSIISWGLRVLCPSWELLRTVLLTCAAGTGKEDKANNVLLWCRNPGNPGHIPFFSLVSGRLMKFQLDVLDMNPSGWTQLRCCGEVHQCKQQSLAARCFGWTCLSHHLLDVLIVPCHCLILILLGISTVSLFLLCPSTEKEISDAFEVLQCLKSISGLFDFPKQDQTQCCLVQTSESNQLSHLQGRCLFLCKIQCFLRVPHYLAEGSAKAIWEAADF